MFLFFVLSLVFGLDERAHGWWKYVHSYLSVHIFKYIFLLVKKLSLILSCLESSGLCCFGFIKFYQIYLILMLLFDLIYVSEKKYWKLGSIKQIQASVSLNQYIANHESLGFPFECIQLPDSKKKEKKNLILRLGPDLHVTEPSNRLHYGGPRY